MNLLPALLVRLALALPLVLVGTTAQAQQTVNRSVPIPADALKGVISSDVFPLIRINGIQLRLTAGGRIYGANNLLVLPANIPNGAKVAFIRDTNGDVKTVWILTEAEIRQR
jgi:hypothetical protein